MIKQVQKCPKCLSPNIDFVIDSDLQWFCNDCLNRSSDPLLEYIEDFKEPKDMFKDMPGIQEHS